MSKSAKSHTGDMQNAQRSSTNNTTTTITTGLSTAKLSTSSTHSSLPPTPFLASRSEVRFALESDFAWESALLSPAEVEVEIETKPATAALPETHAHDNKNDDDDNDDYDIHFLPDHDDYQCYRETETKTLGQGRKGGGEGIHFAADPNECYRPAASWGMQLRATAAAAVRVVKKDGCVCEEGGGAGIPLRGEYVRVFDGCDAIDDAVDHCEDGFHDDCLDNDDGNNDDDYEDADADDDDLALDLNHDPPPPPPGLLDDNDDLPTAVRRFAWTYAKGLGGLVMGIVDGFAMAAAGAGGEVGGRMRVGGGGCGGGTAGRKGG